MAEWIVCSACGLKHTARADGICPRCKSAQGAGALEIPPPPLAFAGAAAPPPPSPATGPIALPAMDGREPFPLGARIAGWVLYGNVLLTIVAMVATKSSPVDPKGGFGGPLPLIIDLVVATFLVGGRDKARGIALARVIIGALVLTPILWSNGGPLLGLMQLCFSGALLLLLVGRAGAARMAVGATLGAGVLLLGLAVVTSPSAAGAARGAMGDLFDLGRHVETAEGIRAPWRISLPAGHWHETRPTKVSDADRAFVWPERDASIFVAVHTLPRTTDVDLDKAADMILGAMQAKAQRVEDHQRFRFTTAQGSALSMRATVTNGGHTAEGWLAIHAGARELAVVIAMATDRTAEVIDELHQIGMSLELGAPGARANEGGDAAQGEDEDGSAGESAGEDAVGTEAE